MGSVAPCPLRCFHTEKFLLGQQPERIDPAALEKALDQDISPIDDIRASAAYRTAMLGQALLKLHAETGVAA